jgi:hypothetical protein
MAVSALSCGDVRVMAVGRDTALWRLVAIQGSMEFFGLFSLPGAAGPGRISLRSCRLLLILMCFLALSFQARAQKEDTVTFANGEKLVGKVTKVTGGTLSFHSDNVGEITVPMKNVVSLETVRPFAAGKKGEKLTRKTVAAKVPDGAIVVEHGTLRVTPANGAAEAFPLQKLDFLIDEPSFQRALREEANPLFGWTGTASLGASVVKSTNSSQTYTGTVGFVRAIPTIAGLPPISKATLNLSGTYGLAKDPTIVAEGDVIQTASISKTSILHGDTEYDRYFNPSIFGLVDASADHNYGNGLELQQTYGGGVGWSVVKLPNNTVNLKATLEYEQQQFYNAIDSGLGTPNENLVGMTLTETWNRTFAHNIKFSQDVSAMAAFNVVQAGSAVVDAKFLFPLYKKLNFSVTSTDNYLGDPPQGYQRNTFQFTTGVTYMLK